MLKSKRKGTEKGTGVGGVYVVGGVSYVVLRDKNQDKFFSLKPGCLWSVIRGWSKISVFSETGKN